MSDYRADLATQLAALNALLAKYTPRKDHFMADLVLHGYARDAFVQAHSVILLVDSLFPRSSYANARAAFEAAQDALLLASDPDKYNDNGALAYCIELVEHEGLQKRWKDASAEWGIVKDRSGSITPEELVEKESAALDDIANGSSDRFRRALGEARKSQRAKRHWSGLSRRDISALLEQRMPSYKGMASSGDAFYGVLSVQAHPRVRSWSEERFVLPDGSLQARPGEEHSTLPVGLTLVAIQMVTLALAFQLGDHSALARTA